METIVETIVPGRYVAADSWVVPGGVPGGEAGTCEYCRFDPEEAKRLLDEAGLPAQRELPRPDLRERTGRHPLRYHNADFEAALAAGDQAPSLDEAVTHYQEAECILAEDMPTIPLTWTQSTTFYGDRLDNVVLNPFSGAIELRQLSVSS